VTESEYAQLIKYLDRLDSDCFALKQTIDVARRMLIAKHADLFEDHKWEDNGGR